MAEPMLLKETGILCGPELRKNGDDMPSLFLSPATNAHGDGRFNPTVPTDDNPDFPLPDPVTGALGLIGLELDSNINDGEANTLTILDNTATTITIDAADGDLTAVAAVGGSYIGVYTFDNLRVRGEAQMSTTDNVIVLGELELNDGTLLTTKILADCACDFDSDSDVDGSDLAAYILDSKGLLLETFAADFGKTNCPQD